MVGTWDSAKGGSLKRDWEFKIYTEWTDVIERTGYPSALAADNAAKEMIDEHFSDAAQYAGKHPVPGTDEDLSVDVNYSTRHGTWSGEILGFDVADLGVDRGFPSAKTAYEVTVGRALAIDRLWTKYVYSDDKQADEYFEDWLARHRIALP